MVEDRNLICAITPQSILCVTILGQKCTVFGGGWEEGIAQSYKPKQKCNVSHMCNVKFSSSHIKKKKVKLIIYII